jgi:hypothetical protein
MIRDLLRLRKQKEWYMRGKRGTSRLNPLVPHSSPAEQLLLSTGQLLGNIEIDLGPCSKAVIGVVGLRLVIHATARIVRRLIKSRETFRGTARGHGRPTRDGQLANVRRPSRCDVPDEDSDDLIRSRLGYREVQFEVLLARVTEKHKLGFRKSIEQAKGGLSFAIHGLLEETRNQGTASICLELL